MDDLTTRLIALAAKRFGIDATTLRPEDDLFDALSIDSLQALDLVTEVEDSFDVEVPDYEVADVRTFAGLADVISRRL